MKKKLFLLLTILCCLALSVGILAACDSESGKQDDGTSATYYTVTFDSQGGSPVNAVEVESGKTVPKPSPDPTKADADFVGWYKDAACTAGNEYDFSAPVTSDIKLYAKWTPHYVYVQFDSDGGYPIIPFETYSYGAELEEPAEPSREGYDFGGWYLDANLQYKAQFPYELTHNVNFYARWIAEGQTTVNFLLAEEYKSDLPLDFGEAVMPSITVDKGTVLEQPDNPPDITYRDADNVEHTLKFSFWNAQYSYNINSTGINPHHDAVLFPVEIKDRDELTLYAVYTEVTAEDTYASLTVHPENGEENTVMYGIMGQKLGVILSDNNDYPFESIGYGQPYRVGYACTGYYKSLDFSAENVYQIPFLLSGESNHVYLRWEKQSDTTVVFRKGFDNEILTEQSVEYNGKVTRPENILMMGYTFDGWFWHSITSVDDYRWSFEYDKNRLFERELTPKWVKTASVITYNVMGGTPIQPLSHSQGRVLYEFPVAQRYDEDGKTYNFLGWYLDEECTVPVEVPYTLEVDVTFYAKWSEPIDTDNFSFTYYPSGDYYSVAINPAVRATVERISVPSVYAGKSVKAIEAFGFENCIALKEVHLHDNINNILNNAFAGCSALVKVELPDAINQLSFDIFKGCESLAEVSCPTDVRYIYSDIFADSPLMINQLQKAEDGLFYWGNILLGTEEALSDNYPATDNEEITAINILNGTQTIAFGALRALAKVESIVFPEGVEYIESNVLPRDKGSLKAVSYPSTVKQIDIIGFSVSAGANYYDFPLTLESITVAEGNPYYRVENGCLLEIESATLIGSLKTATAVPEGVKIIAQNSMRGNVNDTVVIPSDVTTIMGGAFYGGAMSEMNIPDSVGVLADDAFAECENMTSLSLGKRVNLLASSFFKDMDDLAALTCSEENSSMFTLTNVLYDKETNEIIAVADNMTGELRILDGTTEVSRGMFNSKNVKFPNVTSLVIPDSVTSGGELGSELLTSWVFSSPNFTRIEIGAGMPAEAFRELCSLSALTEIVISANNPYVKMADGLVLTADGTEIVGNIGNLTEVVIPDNVTSIREDEYWGGLTISLNKAESIHFGAGISRDTALAMLLGIYYDEYEEFVPGATSVLQYITVSEANPYIAAKDGLLYSKDYSELLYVPERYSADSLVLPAELVSLDTPVYALSHYSMYFSGNDFTYEYYLDASVGSLSVEEGSSLQIIGDNVFRSKGDASQGARFDIGVVDLSNATQLKSIGDYAFSYQNVLTEVVLPDSVETIGEQAFVFDFLLANFNMPANIATIGANAFLRTALLDEFDNLIIDGVLYTANVSTEQETYVVPSGVTRIFSSAITWPRVNAVIIPETVLVVDSKAIIAANYIIVYCEAESRPEGYADNMCDGEGVVVYGYPDNSVGEDGKIYVRDDGALYCLDPVSLTAVIEDVDNTLPEEFAPSSKYEYGGKSYALSAINNRNIINDSDSGLKKIVIPDGVTAIGENAFDRYRNLASVSLPSTLKSIGEAAFRFTGDIESLVIPASVESVGSSAFQSSGIKSVVWKTDADIPDNCFSGSQLESISIEGQIKKIFERALSANLKELVLPASLAEIADNALSSSLQRLIFKGGDNLAIPANLLGHTSQTASSLIYLELGEGIVSIGDAAFRNCASLTGELVLPNTLETIGEEAFIGTQYTSVTFGSAVTAIGERAFDGVPLNDGIDMSRSASLVTVGAYAFRNSELKSLTLPDSVENIGQYAFAKCRSLQVVEFGEGLREIGYYAFSDCVMLEKTIYGGNKLEKIGDRAFYNCVRLVSTDPDYVSGEGAATSYVLPEGVVYIGEYAFYNVSITEITIPSTVETMVFLPFRGCASLTKVNYNAANALHLNQDEQTSYPNTPFYACPQIKTVVIGSTVETMPTYLFYNLTELDCVIFPAEGTVTIGSYAFRKCMSLTEVELTNAVTGISAYAFYECVALKEISIPDSLTFFGQSALSGTDIAFDNVDGVNYYCGWAISADDGVTDVVLQDDTVGIAEYAFAKSSVTSITFADGLKYINNFAFWEAPLKEVTLPDSLETVGTGIFYNCAELLTVTVPFAEGELPVGWSSTWNNKCNAVIVYS